MSNRDGRVRAGWAHLTAAFQYRDYRILWSANLCAGAAHWALIVARGWLVFELTDSSTWVGVVTFAAMIPRFLVAPFAGLLADRLDRRRLLAWSFGVNLGHNLVLAIVAAAGVIEVWHLVVLSLVNGSARATQLAAGGSLIPNLVPRIHILNAIALNASTQHGSRLLGPLVIAPVLGPIGAEGAFYVCTAFYVVGLVQVLRVQTVSTGVVEPGSGTLKNLTAGFDYIYHHYLLLPLIMVIVAHCSLTMAFESLLPVLSREKLGAEGAGFSYLMMAVGAGALVGVIALAGIQDQRARGRLFLVLGLLSGISPVALAVSPNLSVALLSSAFMGATQATFMTVFATIVQSMIPDGIRGRVTSVNNLHIGGFMAVFNLLNGSLADFISASTILTAAGLAFVLSMVISLRSLPLRQLYTQGMPSQVPAPVA